MSTLSFSRAASLLTLSNGVVVPAANNVDSHSNGPWPDGTFKFVAVMPAIPGDGPDSAYGVGPRFLFDVPGREGMEVHAGRANIPDGLGRVGIAHCTMGCIRTTRDGIASILSLHAADGLTEITVL